MDEEERPTNNLEDQLRQKWKNKALQHAKPFNQRLLERPRRNVKDELLKQHIVDLLRQRNEQRKNIFKLAKRYCWTSLIFLMCIVVVQILVRVFSESHDFNLFSGNELQILVVGVFGQFVGLLYVITRSLYDDKNYTEIFKDILNR